MCFRIKIEFAMNMDIAHIYWVCKRLIYCEDFMSFDSELNQWACVLSLIQCVYPYIVTEFVVNLPDECIFNSNVMSCIEFEVMYTLTY